jgi:hypothetical protein
MIDAKMSFARVEAVATPSRDSRLPRLVGLGLAALVSAALWGALATTVAHLL